MTPTKFLTLTLIYILSLPLPLIANATEINTFSATRKDVSSIDYYISNATNKAAANSLLLVLQGSDCNSVLNIKSIFSDYRKALPDADLLLIEKYGINSQLPYSANPERSDCPESYIKNDNPRQRVEDAKTVLDIVSSNHDYKNYVVIGGSEGAVIANLLSSEIKMIDAVIAFNGGGRWFIDDVVHNMVQTTGDKAQVKNDISGFKQFAQHIKNSEPFELNMSGHGYSWWRQMLTLDQEKIIGNITIPLLLIQSRQDQSVSYKQVEIMVRNLNERGKRNLEYVVYDDLDHSFKNQSGTSQLDKVIPKMNSWLTNQIPNDLK